MSEDLRNELRKHLEEWAKGFYGDELWDIYGRHLIHPDPKKYPTLAKFLDGVKSKRTCVRERPP